MSALRVCTANLDYAKRRAAHRAYLRYLIGLCDVLFVQEAKRIRVTRLLPPTWGTMQRIGNASRRGSAICWRRPLVHRDARLRLGTLPFMRINGRLRFARMLPRWMATMDTVLDGKVLTLVSAHWPPLRYAWLWPQMDLRVAALIVQKVKQGHEVLVGGDMNHLPLKVINRLNILLRPHGIGLIAHGDGRIDGFASTVGLDVQIVAVDPFGPRRRLTDHPAVVADISIK